MRDCRDSAFCAGAVSRCSFGACPEEELGCSLTEILPASEGVHHVALGRQFTCAVITAGGLRCWGRNHRGQLGYAHTGNIGDSEAPAAAGNIDVGGPVVQVAAGLSHTCALLTSGQVRCWGFVRGGRLGLGNTARLQWLAEQAGRSGDVGDDETPATVGSVDLGGPAIQLAAGDNFTCALLLGGDVHCWGTSDFGELGYPGARYVGDDETPRSMGRVDLGGPAAFIAAGSRHACAISRTGEVRCWGRAKEGRLGYGNSEDIGDDETPASAGSVALAGHAVHLSAGDTHTCAVLANGAVQCWGDGRAYQLGNDAFEIVGDDELPTARPALDLGAPAVQVAAGGSYTCALLENGAVRCWGSNGSGQLGTGLPGLHPLSSVAPRIELGGDAVQIDAYLDHTCAVLSTRELMCWGDGFYGQLGYGSPEDVGDDETPASVGVVPVLRIPPEPPILPEPQPPVPPPPPIVPDRPADAGDLPEVTADGGEAPELACESGALLCEGSQVVRCNAEGSAVDLVIDCLDATLCAETISRCKLASCPIEELGCAIGEPEPAPDGIAGVALGRRHTCAVTQRGALRCWGRNASGQLGYAHTADIGDLALPASAGDVDVGGPVRQVVAGDDHTCALLMSGEVRCWGEGESGRLGGGNETDVGDDETPASVPSVDLGGPALQLAAGGAFTCALLLDGSVRCWGSGAEGKLGLLTSSLAESVGDNETPASVGSVDLGGPAVFIAAGHDHSCAILGTGDVRCWGRARAGQLGYGNTNVIGDDETPASAGSVALGGRAIFLSLGTGFSCALLSDGNVRCWGGNLLGALGRDESDNIGDNELPNAVPALDLGQRAIRVAAGAGHTCALLEDGTVRCWGLNSNGQLGNATSTSILSFSSAAPRIELGGNAVELAAGGDFTCAILSNGQLTCWGDGRNGQLGYGSTEDVGDDETPASVGTVSVF